METQELQSRVKLDRFIRVRAGKASIQLSSFLSKIGKNESWLAGIKKGSTHLEPEKFNSVLKYLKIKKHTKEYYELGWYVYSILPEPEKEDFQDMYGKEDVEEMYERTVHGPKMHKELEKIVDSSDDNNELSKESKDQIVKILEPMARRNFGYNNGLLSTKDIDYSKYPEIFEFMSGKLDLVKMSWAELDVLTGGKIADRVRTVGQFSPKYLKDILDALNIPYDSDDARRLVSLVKSGFKYNKKKEEMDSEYQRILEEDEKKKEKEEAFDKAIESINTLPIIEPSKSIVEEEKKTEIAESKSSVVVEEKKPSKSLHQARKEFGRFLSYIMVIKGMTISSLSAQTDILEDSLTSIIEGDSTFNIFQAMRLPDLINLDATDTREFNQKYLSTISGNSEIEFPEYVTRYLNTHVAAVMAIAKAADINADDTYWNDMYNKLISDSQ